jgi:putative photosynthetic complex assembly protein 2
MVEIGLPALATIFAWWFSTGLILLLDGLRRETFRRSMAFATVFLLTALSGIWAVREEATVAGAYLGFLCGLAVWGWIELSFLTGMITGPVRTPCPPGLTGPRRVVAAIGAILWHEFAIIAAAAVLVLLSWDAPNQVAVWTFMILWVMRQSTKINIFLGARNTGEVFLPDHLRYIGSFFRHRSMNLLFPVSVMASTLFCAWLFHHAFKAGATPFEVTSASLLGTLAALAVLEHWFLMMPLPIERLWRWAMDRREAAGRPAPRVAAWESGLSAPCDADRLGRLLNAVADGAYGEVESLRGTLRSASGWVQFDLAEGRARVATITPAANAAPRVVAVGATSDLMRLRAALIACLRPAAA